MTTSRRANQFIKKLLDMKNERGHEEVPTGKARRVIEYKETNRLHMPQSSTMPPSGVNIIMAIGSLKPELCAFDCRVMEEKTTLTGARLIMMNDSIEYIY